MLRRTALVVLFAGCEPAIDDCERALARLDRLDELHRRRSEASKARSLDHCRTATDRTRDPIIHCALVAGSDAAAAACIDAVIRDAMKSPVEPDTFRGLNPLLQ